MGNKNERKVHEYVKDYGNKDFVKDCAKECAKDFGETILGTALNLVEVLFSNKGSKK